MHILKRLFCKTISGVNCYFHVEIHMDSIFVVVF